MIVDCAGVRGTARNAASRTGSSIVSPIPSASTIVTTIATMTPPVIADRASTSRWVIGLPHVDESHQSERDHGPERHVEHDEKHNDRRAHSKRIVGESGSAEHESDRSER